MATAIVTVSNFSWEKFLNIEILLWSIRAGISLNVWECWNECVLSTEREGGGDRGSRQHRNWATTFIDVILECVSCTAPLARLGIITLLPYMISPFSTTDNSFLWDQNSFKHGLWSSFDQPWRILFRTCLSALSHDVKPASCFGDNGLVDTVYSIEIELLCLYLHCCNCVSLLLPSRAIPSSTWSTRSGEVSLLSTLVAVSLMKQTCRSMLSATTMSAHAFLGLLSCLPAFLQRCLFPLISLPMELGFHCVHLAFSVLGLLFEVYGILCNHFNRQSDP